MSRIVLATLGSLGDLHPVIGLALELRRRGHVATIATSEFYRNKIGALGLDFRPLRPEMMVVDGAWIRSLMEGRHGPEYLLRDVILPAARDLHTDLVAATAGADLLVASELVYPAPALAATTGLRWVSFSLAPTSLFSLCDPPLLPGPVGTHLLQSLGPAANRLLRAVAKLVSHGWWRPLRELRRDLGLPPGGNPFFEGKYSPRRDLALFSPALQPAQPDWPASTRQCGFVFHDETENSTTLPPAVEEFLAAGPPPLVFTLGSSAVHAANNFYPESVRVAQQLGRRALLLLGPNPPPANLPDTVLAWDYLPFARIFPRAAAIVHQGGVGTTAQALRAGKPMLVMPFAFDQFDNAARMARVGAGRTVSRRQYRAARVARELDRLTRDPRPAAIAAALGARVRAERGTEVACDAIEQALRD